MMKLIVCVDRNNGLSFNHRRQSRDRAVTADILTYAPVQVREFSASLFADAPDRVELCKNFSERAVCFAERLPLPASPEVLILYRWDRVYPADEFLPYDLSAWTLQSAEEFAGYSHERITKEIYTK